MKGQKTCRILTEGRRLPLQSLTDYQIAMAQAGFRLLTIEACTVAPSADNAVCHTGVLPDDQLAELKSTVAEYHNYGAKVLVQLHYSGITNGMEQKRDTFVQELAAAVGKCQTAGVDAIEILAHYQLLFPTIQGIKKQAGTACPIIVRTDDLSIIEISSIAKLLEEAEVNVILVSANSGYLRYLEEKISNSVTLPALLKYLLLPVTNTLALISQRIFCRLARRMY